VLAIIEELAPKFSVGATKVTSLRSDASDAPPFAVMLAPAASSTELLLMKSTSPVAETSNSTGLLTVTLVPPTPTTMRGPIVPPGTLGLPAPVALNTPPVPSRVSDPPLPPILIVRQALKPRAAASEEAITPLLKRVLFLITATMDTLDEIVTPLPTVVGAPVVLLTKSPLLMLSAVGLSPESINVSDWPKAGVKLMLPAGPAKAGAKPMA